MLFRGKPASCHFSEIFRMVALSKGRYSGLSKVSCQLQIWGFISGISNSFQKVTNFKQILEESESEKLAEMPRTKSSDQELKQTQKHCDGRLYTLTESSQLLAKFYRIVDRVLYIYSSKREATYSQMIYLGQGASMMPFTPIIQASSSKRLFGLVLRSGQKKLKLYILGEGHYRKWKNAFSLALGVKIDIESDYDLGKNIERERNSQVRHGVCRTTGNNVAIQVLEKRNYLESELQQIIQINRMCRHQHIVELTDVYEDLERVYLVGQYYGVTLKQYNQTLSSRFANIEPIEMIGIIKQVLLALQYLKTYNIVHRNITNDHVLLTGHFYDLSYQSKQVQIPQVKLANFSLSTIFLLQEERHHSLFNELNECIDLYSLGALVYNSVPGLCAPVKPTVLHFKGQALDYILRLLHETDKFKLKEHLKQLQQFFVYMMQNLLGRHIYEQHLSCKALLELSEFQL